MTAPEQQTSGWPPPPEWFGKVRQLLSDVALAAGYSATDLEGLPAFVAALKLGKPELAAVVEQGRATPARPCVTELPPHAGSEAIRVPFDDEPDPAPTTDGESRSGAWWRGYRNARRAAEKWGTETLGTAAGIAENDATRSMQAVEYSNGRAAGMRAELARRSDTGGRP